jgi:hypothetical protein
MFKINEDKSIYVTRGDAVAFSVKANKGSSIYTFPKGSIVRFKVVEKKACDSVVLQKDFEINAPTTIVSIYLSENDTRFGDVISKPTDYWYEVELNPHTDPQTILGYDDVDGPKIFKLFPEGKDLEYNPTPQDLGTVDSELDAISERPIQNQAVTRAITELRQGLEIASSTHFEIKASIQNLVDLELNAVKSEYVQRTSDEFESIKEECVQDTHDELQAIKEEYVHDLDGALEEATTKAVTYATQNAKESENNAKEYMDSAKDYMDTSMACMNASNIHMGDAKKYSDSAKGYMDTSKGYMDDSKAYSDLSKQYMEDALKTTPEGYNELVSKVGLMDIVKSTALTYPNTKPGGLRLLEMDGATVQNGEPSTSNPIAIENVGDCVEMVQGGYDGNNGNHYTKDTSVCSKNRIPCKSGDVVKLSYERNANLAFLYYGKNGYISYKAVANTAELEQTIPSNITHFTMFIDENVNITPQTVGKITLTVNGKHVVQIVTTDDNGNERIATIFLDEPLREGDRLVKVDGVWNVERNIAEIVFDGSDDEPIYYDTANKMFNSPIYGKLRKKGKCWCDRYTTYLFDITLWYVNGKLTINSNCYLCLKDTDNFDSVETIKEYFAEKPITVQYELATPTYTPLDTQSQLALNGLETFKDMTYLEVDSKIKPSGIEVEYGTSQVGAYTLKSLLNTESNALKIEDAVNTMLLIGAE